MRILFVHAGAELYGADRILLELVAGLIARGHRAIVVLPGPGPLTGLLEAAGATVHLKSLGVLRRKYFHPLGLAGRVCRMLRAARWLESLIRSEAIDLVHTNTSVVWPGALAARLAAVPHVWHIHEMTTRPAAVRRVLSWVIPRWSASVVCVSKAVLDNLVAGSAANRGKGLVIYNGITPRAAAAGARERVRAEFGWPSEALVVGMMGRVNRWKGQGRLVEAARLLLDPALANRRDFPVRFLLVGGTFAGEESLLDDLRRQVARLDLEAVVRVEDFRLDAAEVLQAMDVFVLPSIEPDPLPTVVLEAMYAGLPVVAYPHGGVCEMIEDGVSGSLARGLDAGALAQAIAPYIEYPELRSRTGTAAGRRVRSVFSPQRFLDDFEALYRRLITHG